MNSSTLPKWRRYALLLIFSTAQMLDIFNVTAPTIALPEIASDLHVLQEDRQWAINAYSLTFGAFLLTAGRFGSLFGSKRLFVSGFALVGICSIICGFSVRGPMLFVFRAIQGIGAAMTIPAALTMITILFPDHREQDRALGIFAGFGAMGNVSGLILGGVISQLLNWRWIFWIMAMVILPLALLSFFLTPSDIESEDKESDQKDWLTKLRELDWLGLCSITLSLILFIYALTTGPARGWKSANVLAPLIISLVLVPIFAWIETVVKEPLIPPGVWRLNGFAVLVGITFSEYLAMNVVIFQESLVFQQVWGTSALSAALRIIPFGITGFFTTILTPRIIPYIRPQYILILGQLLMLAGALLLAFAPDPNNYWDRVVPGIICTALGVASGFVAANIEMLRTPLLSPHTLPKLRLTLGESTALIGSIFNADLQIGSTLGLAVATAITSHVNGTSINAATSTADASQFAGYKASYWFLVGLTAFEAVLAAVGLRGRSSSQIAAAAQTEARLADERGEATLPASISSTDEKAAERLDTDAAAGGTSGVQENRGGFDGRDTDEKSRYGSKELA